MRMLRPRYSLLTLLILTALIAGGTLYYGVPHRAVMSDPPTPHEQEMLDFNNIVRNLRDSTQADVLEYEYKNHWKPENWSTVVGRSLKATPEMIEFGRAEKMWAVVAKSDKSKFVAELPPNYRGELIVTWVARCDNPIVPEPTIITTDTGTTVQLPAFAFQSINYLPECYFLTAQKQIFRTTLCYGAFFTTPTTISEITNERMRIRLAEELALIPSSQ